MASAQRNVEILFLPHKDSLRILKRLLWLCFLHTFTGIEASWLKRFLGLLCFVHTNQAEFLLHVFSLLNFL